MKKLSALILGLGLLAGSTVNTFAIDFTASGSALNPSEGDANKMSNEVLGQVEGETKYSIDVMWGDMKFKWNSHWDPSTHSYVNNTEGSNGWEENQSAPTANDCASGDIKFINHSNANIKATMVFNPVEGGYGIKAAWDNAGATDAESDVEVYKTFETAEGTTRPTDKDVYETYANDTSDKDDGTRALSKLVGTSKLFLSGQPSAKFLAKDGFKGTANAQKIGTVTITLVDTDATV